MGSRSRQCAFFVAAVLLWGILAESGLWDRTLFPSPIAVASSLWQTLADGELGIAALQSLRRLILGYAISLAIGVPLGIVLARRAWMDDTIGLLVVGQQALPSVCWLPVALLWFGPDERAILFVVVMGSLASIAVTVQDGVRSLPPTYVRAARTMGVHGFRMFREVLLPASLPSILTAAKLGWAYAWRGLMAGELLVAGLGLGHMLMRGRKLGDIGLMMGVMLVIVAAGLLTDRLLFGALERRVRERWGLARA